MALHKLPKQYHPDFRIAGKKPIGSVFMEQGEYGDYWLFQNRDFLSNSGSRNRRLENVGGTFNRGLQLSPSTSTYAKFSDANDPYYESMTGGMTVAFKMPSAPVMTQYDTLVSCCTSAGSGWRIWTRSSSNFKLYFEVFDGAGKQAISTTPISQMVNKWIVCTHDGSSIRLYIDGVLEDTTACGSIVYPFSGRSTKGFIGGMPANDNASSVQRSPQMSIDHLYIAPKAIDSPETFEGNPYQILKPKNDPVYFTSDVAGGDTLSPSFIPTQELFYQPVVTRLLQSIEPSSIATSEVFYTHTVSPQSTGITPQFIASGESVYTPDVTLLLKFIDVTHIPSEEIFYSPVVSNTLQTIAPLFTLSEEVFFRATVIGGDTVAIPIPDRATWQRVASYLSTLPYQGNNNDIIVQWLVGEGYEGSFNDAFDAYLQDNGYPEGSLTDKYAAWRKE